MKLVSRNVFEDINFPRLNIIRYIYNVSKLLDILVKCGTMRLSNDGACDKMSDELSNEQFLQETLTPDELELLGCVKEVVADLRSTDSRTDEAHSVLISALTVMVLRLAKENFGLKKGN